MTDPSQKRAPSRYRFSTAVVAAVCLDRKGNARFAMALALGLLVWLGGWMLLIAGQLGEAHPDNVWVKEAYALKLAAAERLRGTEKMLLLGGSATMFGVDSLQLAGALGRPAVNLGVNAGLGSYEVPQLIDHAIEPGDLVIMPLEYRLLLWDGVPSYVTLSWALEHPEALSRWRLKTLLWGLWSVPLSRIIEGYRGFDSVTLPRGPYGAHNLNEWGDQINTASVLRTEAQQQALIGQPPERYDKLYDRSTLGLKAWQYWWQRWQSRGACVVVVPPPFLFVAAYNSPSYTAFFDGIPGRVREQGVPYLGHPSDGFFPLEAMFDTNYHLTAESRASYTGQLAASLRSSDLDCFAKSSR
ncbi:MAG: hypothetical protein VW202_03875 [Halieaceae bacterium]